MELNEMEMLLQKQKLEYVKILEENMELRQTVIYQKQKITDLESNLLYDGMTGAYSRRTAFEMINDRIARKIPCSVVYFDLNNLKELNDRYGHKFGDNYIKSFTNFITVEINPLDKLCRIGGDEFVLITDETNYKDILFRNVFLLEKYSSKYYAEGINQSFAFGIAIYDGKEDVTCDMLIAEADKRMYSMKRELKFDDYYTGKGFEPGKVQIKIGNPFGFENIALKKDIGIVLDGFDLKTFNSNGINDLRPSTMNIILKKGRK